MNYPSTRREREVWEACDDLHAKGENLTIDAISQRLLALGYKKGNPNQTVHYRRSWSVDRGVSLKAKQNEPSNVMSDPISRAVALVREEIQTEAQIEISKIEEKAQADIAGITTQHQQLQINYENLVTELEKIKQTRDEIHAENIAITEDNTHLSIQLGKYETQIQIKDEAFRQFQQEKENHIIRLEKIFQENITRLEKIIDKKEQDMENLRSKIEEQRHQHITTIDQLKIECQKAEKEIERASANAQTVQIWNQTLQQDLYQLQKEMKEQKYTHDQLQMAYLEAQSLIQQQDEKIHQIERSLQAHITAREEQEKLVKQWQIQADKANNEKTELQIEIKVLKNLISQLRESITQEES